MAHSVSGPQWALTLEAPFGMEAKATGAARAVQVSYRAHVVCTLGSARLGLTARSESRCGAAAAAAH